MPREKGRRLWGDAGAGYLPGSIKVKAWGELVDCCIRVVIIGSVCVEIC